MAAITIGFAMAVVMTVGIAVFALPLRTVYTNFSVCSVPKLYQR